MLGPFFFVWKIPIFNLWLLLIWYDILYDCWVINMKLINSLPKNVETDVVFVWENLRWRKSCYRFHIANMCSTLIAYIIGYNQIQLVHFVDVPSFPLSPNSLILHPLLILLYQTHLTKMLSIWILHYQIHHCQIKLVLPQISCLGNDT